MDVITDFIKRNSKKIIIWLIVLGLTLCTLGLYKSGKRRKGL
nr:MAG TPA: Protein of unknown function (DUF2659) [Herelleviridae sp.]